MSASGRPLCADRDCSLTARATKEAQLAGAPLLACELFAISLLKMSCSYSRANGGRAMSVT